MLDKAIQVTDIVNKIDNLPLNDNERVLYQRNIANIYQIAILSDVDLAKAYAKELKNEIERNLIIRKKQVLFFPVIIVNLIIILFSYILYKNNIIIEIAFPIMFGEIGGILSIILKNIKIEIDYNVSDSLLYFESFKLILLSNIVSIVGYLTVKSEVLLYNMINEQNGEYLKYLIYILCGYSQTFIPNILKNLEIKNNSDE